MQVVETEKIRVARLAAAHKRPYLSAAIFAMQPVPKPDLGTFGVSENWVLYYDPVKLEEWDLDELVAVLIHEVAHLLRDHAKRAKAQNVGINHQLWNVAVDAEINDDLLAEKLKLPEGCITPEFLRDTYPKGTFDDNDLGECYYHELMKHVDKIEIQMCSPGAGNCGSAADGQQREWEDQENPEGDGEDNESKVGLTEAEGELIRRQVAKDIKNSAKQMGHGSGHWVTWAEEYLEPPKVNWRTLLNNAIKRAVKMVAG